MLDFLPETYGSQYDMKGIAIYLRTPRTEPECLSYLHRSVEDCGEFVAGSSVGGTRIEGKGKNIAWKRLLADLLQVGQILFNDVGDISGHVVGTRFTILATPTVRGVSVAAPSLNVGPRSGMRAAIPQAAAYRRV